MVVMNFFFTVASRIAFDAHLNVHWLPKTYPLHIESPFAKFSSILGHSIGTQVGTEFEAAHNTAIITNNDHFMLWINFDVG